MALWPAAFTDPLLSGGAWGGGPGLDPLALGYLPAGGFVPGLGSGGQPFLDPCWLPGATAGSRRRISGPPAPGAGGGGEAGEAREGGEERRRRAHEPQIVGPAGWSRSIPCDFIEREKEYVVRADIPGVRKSEIHVDVHDGSVLRFGHNPNAEREKEDEEEEGIFHRAERVTAFRNRNLRLPDDADALAVEKASYEDGVLTIVIPKNKVPGRPEARELQIE